jgi:hypothetical protein
VKGKIQKTFHMTLLIDKETVTEGIIKQFASEIAGLPFNLQEVFLKELSEQLRRSSITRHASPKSDNKKIATRLAAASGKIFEASTNMYMIRVDVPEKSPQ